MVKYILKSVDSSIARFTLRVRREKNALLIFRFHGLLRDESELAFNVVNPQQGVTVGYFDEFVKYFLNQKYTFVSPVDILNGLDKDSKYIMITFDDGYFNNVYALPVLKEYSIPALFFISTDNIKNNKSFWWDVVYRQRIKEGKSVREIEKECGRLLLKTSENIEEYILRNFGSHNREPNELFKPLTDIDRPFTRSELKDFSEEEFVFLGNHTCRHDILTNYSPDDVKLLLVNAQDAIYDITGKKPAAVSYPNGRYSKEVIKIAEEIGFRLGVTVVQTKNYLPLDNMRLGRFVLDGSKDLIEQCELARSDYVMRNKILNLVTKVKGRY